VKMVREWLRNQDFARRWSRRLSLEVALRRDRFERLTEEWAGARRLRARFSLPADTLRRGRVDRRQPVASALISLRLGVAHLVARTSRDIDVEVRHRWFPQEGLEWSSFDPLSEDAIASLGETAVDVQGTADGIPVRVERAVTTRSNFRFDRGWSWRPQTGYLDGVQIGVSIPQRTWHVWLLGIGQGCGEFTFDGVRVELRICEAPDGLAVADLPRLVEAMLNFDEPVDANQVRTRLDESLTWVLELFAGADVVPAGIWPHDGTSGLLTDYGRPLLKPPRRQVHGRDFETYLAAVIPAWNLLDSDGRMTTRVAISALKAARSAHLEMSIIVMASMLELLAEEWLPRFKSRFALSKPTKKKITRDIRTAVATHAPGSELSKRLPVMFGYLFSRPASERFGRLFDELGLAFDVQDLANFTTCRNSVAHSSSSGPSRDDRVRAMLFGYSMVARCVLARLGYKGVVYDERSRSDVTI
jgi:hypothetical protein